MSGERVISLSERDVRSIASEICDERNREIIAAVNSRFDRLEDSLDRRDKKLIDDLKREIKSEMMPIIGEFKDKAVLQAEKNTDDKLFLLLGVRSDDGKGIDELRDGLNHAKEAATYRKRIGRLIADRATTSIITLIAGGTIYAVVHFVAFAESPVGKFLGVMENDSKAL